MSLYIKSYGVTIQKKLSSYKLWSHGTMLFLYSPFNSLQNECADFINSGHKSDLEVHVGVSMETYHWTY